MKAPKPARNQLVGSRHLKPTDQSRLLLHERLALPPHSARQAHPGSVQTPSASRRNAGKVLQPSPLDTRNRGLTIFRSQTDESPEKPKIRADADPILREAGQGKLHTVGGSFLPFSRCGGILTKEYTFAPDHLRMTETRLATDGYRSCLRPIHQSVSFGAKLSDA